MGNYRFVPGQLPLNTDPLVEDQFYMQLHSLRYYHCAGARDTEITWDLIESFQLNEMIRGTYTQDKKYGSFYIPVFEKARLGLRPQRAAKRLPPSFLHASRYVQPVPREAAYSACPPMLAAWAGFQIATETHTQR